MAFSTLKVVPMLLLDIVMQTVLETQKTTSQHLDIFLCSVLEQSHGGVRNNNVFVSQLPRQNTLPWPVLPRNLSG